MDNNSYYYSKEFGCYVDDIASKFDLWLEHIQLEAEQMDFEELNKNYLNAIIGENKELEELYSFELYKRFNFNVQTNENINSENDNQKDRLENYTPVEEDELPY